MLKRFFRRRRVLELETTASTEGPRTVWQHRIHGLGRKASALLLGVVTGLVDAVTEPGQRAFVGFSPLDGASSEDWKKIAAAGWTMLKYLPEESSGRWILQRAWILGFAHSPQKFAEVYAYAWGMDHGEGVLVVPAGEADDGTLLTALRSEAYPGNERALVPPYHTVIGRALDGLWLTVVSDRVDREHLVALLRRIASGLPDVDLRDS